MTDQTPAGIAPLKNMALFMELIERLQSRPQHLPGLGEHGRMFIGAGRGHGLEAGDAVVAVAEVEDQIAHGARDYSSA